MLFSDERRELYKELVEGWGKEAQLLMCIEEMSELTKELCKYFREDSHKDPVKYEKLIDAICDETADVYNMLDQISYMFGEERVEKHRSEKLKRVKVRFDEWQNKNKK